MKATLTRRPDVTTTTATCSRGGRRGENQDTAVATTINLPSPIDREATLIATADGVGGRRCGHVAAALCGGAFVSRMLEQFAQAVASGAVLEANAVHAMAEEAAIEADATVRRAGRSDPALATMATTLVAAVVFDGLAHLVWCGDSRAYLHRDGRLTRLTRDHSLVAELVQEGNLRPEEATAFPGRNRITRCVGLEGAFEVDSRVVALQHDDLVLLASDGVNERLTPRDLQSRVNGLQQGGQHVSRWPEALVDAAFDAGSRDNITVALLHHRDDEPACAPSIEQTLIGGFASELPQVLEPFPTF